jgi:L-rhamnose isomerase/sugar isomerase
LIDWGELQSAQRSGNIVDAERVYQKAFRTDVTMAVEQWRRSKGLESDPLIAFRESGYLEKVTLDRTARREQLGINQSSSYA